MKLLHEASGVNADEQDIPEIATRKAKLEEGRRQEGRRQEGPRTRRTAARRQSGHTDAGSRGRGAEGERFAGRPPSSTSASAGPTACGPKDLVGAIANETHLSGREIGPIRITENFSTVGVPSDAVDDVIDAMKRTTIKGKKAKVRRDRDG